MEIAFLYPGQGAQYSGMGRDLFDASHAVRALYQEASDLAGWDVAAVSFEGSDEELRRTDRTQTVITTHALAAHTILAARGITAGRAAGFSLGEYAALVDAGVISVADALRMVGVRGEIMERVSRTHDGESGPAGMAAIMGLDLPQVQEALQALGRTDVAAALYNSPGQVVIGGTADGIAAASGALKEAGARRVVPLKTSGPFHTPLMAPARQEFAAFANEIRFSDPRRPVYSNVTAAPAESGAQARTLCLDQLVSTVRWADEERRLHADGTTLAIEVGPGRVLAGLWSALGKVDEAWPKDAVRSAGTLEEIDALTRELEGDSAR